MITWDEKFSTGFESIDKQHKMLFEFTNDLGMIIQEGRGMSYMVKSSAFLEKYIKAHFQFEEDCMFKNQCPVAGKNKIAHQKFLEAFEEYKTKALKDVYSDKILIDLHQFLEDWIKNHIMTIDTNLKSCAKQ